MASPTRAPSPLPPHAHSWMKLALEEARKALEFQDVPIGAILLSPQGKILSRAYNEREKTQDPTAHAEVLALRRGVQQHEDSWRLEECTLVVTLEPCTMCAGAISLARVGRVIFGAWDQKAGAAGSVFDALRDPRLNHFVEVYPGVMEEESSALLKEFFSHHRKPPQEHAAPEK